MQGRGLEFFGGKKSRIWKWSKCGIWRKEERKRKKATTKLKDESEFLSDFVMRVKRVGWINFLLSLKVCCHNRAKGWKSTIERGQLELERRNKFLSHWCLEGEGKDTLVSLLAFQPQRQGAVLSPTVKIAVLCTNAWVDKTSSLQTCGIHCQKLCTFYFHNMDLRGNWPGSWKRYLLG